MEGIYFLPEGSQKRLEEVTATSDVETQAQSEGMNKDTPCK